MSGYAASRLQRQSAKPQRVCQRKSCAQPLPETATKARKFCSDLCRNAHNEPSRKKRSQVGRREYFKEYQRKRRGRKQ